MAGVPEVDVVAVTVAVVEEEDVTAVVCEAVPDVVVPTLVVDTGAVVLGAAVVLAVVVGAAVVVVVVVVVGMGVGAGVGGTYGGDTVAVGVYSKRTASAPTDLPAESVTPLLTMTSTDVAVKL